MAYRFAPRSTTPGEYRLAPGTLAQLIALGDIQSGVGRGDGDTGTLVLPTEAQVESGVGFGAAGTEFTGSLAGGDYATGYADGEAAQLVIDVAAVTAEADSILDTVTILGVSGAFHYVAQPSPTGSTRNDLAAAIAYVLNATPAMDPAFTAAVDNAPELTLETLSELKVFVTVRNLTPIRGVGDDSTGATAEAVVSIVCRLTDETESDLDDLTGAIAERLRDADMVIGTDPVIVTGQTLHGDGDHPIFEGNFRGENVYLSAVSLECLL